MRLTETKNLSLLFLLSLFSVLKAVVFLLSPFSCASANLIVPWFPAFFWLSTLFQNCNIFPHILFTLRQNTVYIISTLRILFLITLQTIYSICLNKIVKHQLPPLLHHTLMHLDDSHTVFHQCYSGTEVSKVSNDFLTN